MYIAASPSLHPRDDPVDYDYRKQMYAVVFIHLILWALAWTFAYVVRVKKHLPGDGAVTSPTNADGTIPTAGSHKGRFASAVSFVGAENAERVARMTFILALANAVLVAELLFNTSKATAGLQWLFMVISVVHVLAVTFTRHPYVPLGFGVLTFAISIVIFALAFRSPTE
ncbi:uncharacterized protein EV422DRAFT_514812 [Fimicolochytrium jonesii]|uniref:uncharacterized protein n=1 Tax=Fimicolochytrium jonesii TaxID=1396493 RepID=UPI0022FECE49|nr:uncharacterized protein EV422DRAFT_514812 [Fimicolochytrium jonesii]KAI8825954.1 hypothetical protein EV422DRAFT_514812 [Fimicolochytrium jonesii]